MSIKKIPICPFCRKEMKRTFVIADTVELIVRRSTATSSDGRTTYTNIERSWNVTPYICEACGFVALWHGELE